MASVNQVAQESVPVQAVPQAVPSANVVGESKPFWKKWWFWAVVVVVVAGVLLFLLI